MSPLEQYQEHLTNALTQESATGVTTVWRPLYSAIYQANAIEEGLSKDDGRLQAEPIRRRLLGEAYFLRAYSYFMLVNIWGDVPLITKTDVNLSSVAARSPQDLVYGQIVQDLEDASAQLHDNDSGLKIRAGHIAAQALLARVHLYRKDWEAATVACGEVIGRMPEWENNPTNVFEANHPETIFELWKQNGVSYGSVYIPANAATVPIYQVREELRLAFDQDDARIGTYFVTNTAGQVYPYKYKQRITGSLKEFDILIRLPEIYLIRAEAHLMMDELTDARLLLDKLRARYGLQPLDESLSKEDLLDELVKERYREFFGEGGHRFFDLKRWGMIDRRIKAVKGSWDPRRAVYPIPFQEVNLNRNIEQNDGYN